MVQVHVASLMSSVSLLKPYSVTSGRMLKNVDDIAPFLIWMLVYCESLLVGDESLLPYPLLSLWCRLIACCVS